MEEEMEIIKVYIDSFGHFEQKELIFDRRWTNIVGPNESGKSTLFYFIEAMLFGFKAVQKKMTLTDEVGGYIDVQIQSEKYRIQRFRQEKQGKAQVYHLDDHSFVGSDAWLKEQLPLTLKEMESIYFINPVLLWQQSQLSADEFQQLAFSLLQTGNDHLLSLEKRYQKQRKELFKARGTGEIQRLMKEYQQIQQQIRSYQPTLTIDDYENELAQLIQKENQLKQKQSEELGIDLSDLKQQLLKWKKLQSTDQKKIYPLYFLWLLLGLVFIWIHPIIGFSLWIIAGYSYYRYRRIASVEKQKDMLINKEVDQIKLWISQNYPAISNESYRQAIWSYQQLEKQLETELATEQNRSTELEIIQHQKKELQLKMQQSLQKREHLSMQYLLQKESDLKEQLLLAIEDYQKLQLKQNWIRDLQEANQDMTRLLQQASDYLAVLTGYRYHKIIFQENQIFVQGKTVCPLSTLSMGTKQQLLIAIRLSFMMSSALSLPILMDEGWVFFDAERQEALQECLQQLNRQCITLTTQPVVGAMKQIQLEGSAW